MSAQPGEGTDVPEGIDIHTTAGKLADLERRVDEAVHASSEKAVARSGLIREARATSSVGQRKTMPSRWHRAGGGCPRQTRVRWCGSLYSRGVGTLTPGRKTQAERGPWVYIRPLISEEEETW